MLKILFAILFSYWIWSVNWSERGPSTYFYVFKTYAPYIRAFCNLLIIAMTFKIKKFSPGYLFILLMIPILVFPTIEAQIHASFILSISSILIIPTAFSILPSRKYILSLIILLLLFSYIIFLFFDLDCFFGGFCSKSQITALYLRRFSGFFGGPIVPGLFTLSGIYLLNNEQDIFYKKFGKLLTLLFILMIPLSLSVSAIYVLIIYLISFLSLSSKIKLPNIMKIKRKNLINLQYIIIISLISFICFLYWDKIFEAFDLFTNKVFIIINFLGFDFQSSGLLDNTLRAQNTLAGRIKSINSSLSELSFFRFMFGSAISTYRDNSISESGILSMISMLGLPLTIIYLNIFRKLYGIRLTFVFLITSIPYNLILAFPFILVIPYLIPKKDDKDFKLMSNNL